MGPISSSLLLASFFPHIMGRLHWSKLHTIHEEACKGCSVEHALCYVEYSMLNSFYNYVCCDARLRKKSVVISLSQHHAAWRPRKTNISTYYIRSRALNNSEPINLRSHANSTTSISSQCLFHPPKHCCLSVFSVMLLYFSLPL